MHRDSFIEANVHQTPHPFTGIPMLAVLPSAVNTAFSPPCEGATPGVTGPFPLGSAAKGRLDGRSNALAAPDYKFDAGSTYDELHNRDAPICPFSTPLTSGAGDGPPGCASRD